MLRFVTVFIIIYTSIHALFYTQAKILLPENRFIRALFILLMIFLIMAPVFNRALDRYGYDFFAQLVGTIGYCWMGFIFLAFWGAIIIYVLAFFIWCVNVLTHVSVPSPLGKTPIFIMITTVIALVIYGSYEARHIKIERISIQTEKLSTGTNPFTIIQISDLHLGLFTRINRLNTIVETINSLSPDILVATGDIVDGSGDHLAEMAAILKQIQPRFGKYAVLGNHEFYIGVEKSLKFFEESEFTVLRGKAITIDSLINVAGVDDSRTPISDLPLLSSTQNGRFTLFLKHRPLIDENSLGLFDLQLSGHTHSGQIFPFHYMVSLHFPYLAGLFELQKGSKLYVNRGTGTWGPQIRILAPPEITVIELSCPRSESVGKKNLSQ